MYKTVVIDPGHGGHAPGCVAGRLVESHVALGIAKMVESALQDCNLNLSLTRNDDVTTTQVARRAFSLAEQADLVVSIHINAHTDATIGGADIFRDNENVSRILAHEFAHSMPLELRSGRVWDVEDKPGQDDDWLERPRVIVDGHHCPTILVECGYATNDRDRHFLLSSWGKERVAFGIAQSIAMFCSLSE